MHCRYGIGHRAVSNYQSLGYGFLDWRKGLYRWSVSLGDKPSRGNVTRIWLERVKCKDSSAQNAPWEKPKCAVYRQTFGPVFPPTRTAATSRNGIVRKCDLCKSPRANRTEMRPVQLFRDEIGRNFDLCKSRGRNLMENRPLQLSYLHRSLFRQDFPWDGRPQRRSACGGGYDSTYR